MARKQPGGRAGDGQVVRNTSKPVPPKGKIRRENKSR